MPSAQSMTSHRAALGRRLAAVVLVGLGLGLLVGGTAGAQGAEGGSSGPRVVSVITLTGLVDPVLEDFLTTSIDDAERHGAVALVLQVDLEGVVIPSADYAALLDRIHRATVPVDIWVGPSGSQLTGSAALLAVVADEVGMAPGTRIGGAVDVAADPSVGGPPAAGAPPGTRRAALATAPMDNVQAQAAGVARQAPTLGDFIVDLPGVETKQITQNGQARREPVTAVVFTQTPLLANFMHTVASPPVAYLLFAIGAALLVFELFTAGVGIAGSVGAVCFVLACYGLTVLPNHWYGIASLSLAMVAFAVDVQTGVPRVWTGIGMVLFAVGSVTLYPGTDGVGISWLTVVVGLVGMALTFVAGMPSMVRTRFSTPTIGREWMIGEMGRAVTDVSPDGVVEIRGAQWRATTNRATPIESLDRVRVVGIDGLVLEVEPESGGARDYRERG